MNHPHDPLIRAWLDGQPVQYLQGEVWIDIEPPAAVSKTPHFYPDCSYRLKPIQLRYRLGLLVADTLLDADVLARRGVTWLGDWQNVTR